MEPRLGLRLVRGPDWCWGDQDGGEGCVGTVVEVGEGGRSAMVQWDAGTRALYRCGEDDKFDLRVFDAAPTGLYFPDVICSGCYMEGVAGIHWQCAHCFEYHLCHSCYLLGRHCQEHPFFRVESKEQAARVKVSCRAGAKRVEAKGVFVGAEVVRGPHWRFGDQDGGAGKAGRVVAIEGLKNLTSRSVAKVEWSTGGLVNIYRVGHKGKVDLCCTATGSCGNCFPEQLATLGLGAAVTVFDEEEIVAGDLVKVELDPDVFKMMHEAAGLWNDKMAGFLSVALLVMSVREQHRLFVTAKWESFLVCSDTVTKLKHCRVGQTVRVISDLSLLQQQNVHYGIWIDDMFMTAGQIGRVTDIYNCGTVQVYVQGRGWVFNPLCLEPAPGEASHYTPDPNNENIGMLSNTTYNGWKDKIQLGGITNKALLEGDLKALESFLYSNQTQQETKEKLLTYYALTGMMDALRLFLSSDADINPVHIETVKIIGTCIMCNNVESVTAMLESGVDVNSVVNNGMNMLQWAVLYGNSDVVRVIATSPGVILDTKDFFGHTAIHVAQKLSNHIKTAILLAAGCNVANLSVTPMSPFRQAAFTGNLSVMEVLLVHGKKYFNLTSSDEHGWAPLHIAATFGYTQVCSLLSSVDCIDLNIRSEHTKFTPLHMAVTKYHWSVVECLVGWGAALDLTNSDGFTPLHIVAGSKSHVIPETSQLKQVREELSVASGGRAVEGYIAVACFLVREGADWHIKDKDGVSPHQALPPAMAVLISEYLKKHPGPGIFHGSLRREQQQHKLQVLPLKLKLALPPPTSSATSATATDSLSSKAIADSTTTSKDYASFGTGVTKPEKNSALLPKAKFDKDTDAAKKLVSGKPPVATSLQPPASGHDSVQPSGLSRQPCLLCEDHPASIRFSPCGHTVLCSECAQRATKCLQCRAYVESKTVITAG